MRHQCPYVTACSAGPVSSHLEHAHNLLWAGWASLRCVIQPFMGRLNWTIMEVDRRALTVERAVSFPKGGATCLKEEPVFQHESKLSQKRASFRRWEQIFQGERQFSKGRKFSGLSSCPSGEAAFQKEGQFSRSSSLPWGEAVFHGKRQFSKGRYSIPKEDTENLIRNLRLILLRIFLIIFFFFNVDILS